MMNEKQYCERRELNGTDDLDALLRRGEKLHNQAIYEFFSALVTQVSGLWKKQRLESHPASLKQRVSH